MQAGNAIFGFSAPTIIATLQPVNIPTLSTEANPCDSSATAVEAFIQKWQGKDGGERANYQLFITELCALIGTAPPEPASSDHTQNAYVFERQVEFANAGSAEGSSKTFGYIDCYKRGSFVFETKQGVEKKTREALSEAGREREARRRTGNGVRGSRAWDATLVKARNQADRYIRALHSNTEGRPPFLIVADVGHCIELYAEFTRSGGIYTPFPDARSHRIMLAELARPDIRERLRLVWEDPLSLDPARRTAAVTREVAAKLAALAKSLEQSGHSPRLAAEFMMRCIFTMFAEDVELIPKGSFSEMLKSLRGQTHIVPSMLESLWRAMDKGEFFPAIWFREHKLLRFNGGLFHDPRALKITDDQLELLIESAKADWRDVEPAIFGTLLERALDPTERHKLGAHYTPRAYVERLVLPTVIEPLRADWQAVQAAAVQLANEDKEKQARAEIEVFHRRLCEVRVLDPACGTGNFLYVTLEHLKRLEGEVLDTLENFGGNRTLEMDTATVRPGQMLGIEINPRAAVIAELVLWIGYLQWHLRTAGDVRTISEPILQSVRNIEARDAILSYDDKQVVVNAAGIPETHWDGRTTKPHPVTGRPVPDESARTPIFTYTNPRPASWPEADFIVGNPPFIGASRMRLALGDGYTETLRKTISNVPESADFVMYWWDHAAALVRQGKVRRFGFISTNSLRQTFNRRVLEKHLGEKTPLSLIFAIPDHPWVDDVEAAAVRVAMTVGEAGDASGLLQSVESEEPGDESYKVTFSERVGKIAADLKVGADVAAALSLKSNSEISSRGVQTIGAGFIVTREEAQKLGFGKTSEIEKHIREYRNGKDLTTTPRGVMVIDLYGLSESEVRTKFPEIYQWVHERVKPERDQNNRDSYRKNWWIHGEARSAFRPALQGLDRYITTVETSKHRFFQFLDASILPDNMLVNIALEDGYEFGVLSSRSHVTWALAQGGILGPTPRYNKTRCFETFPFPDCTESHKSRIRELGEALDAHRKARQSAHPELTMTGMYNVLEKLRAGKTLTAKEKTIHEQGLVSVLKQIHDDLDTAVLAAYGWDDLAGSAFDTETLLTRLVALNHERTAEEERGHIRWLRPEYQAPDATPTQTELPGTEAQSASLTKRTKKAESAQPFPKALADQIRAVRTALETLPAPTDAPTIAKHFKGARRDRIEAILESLQALGHAQEAGDGKWAV
jgi:hypothetical protein